MNDPAGRTYKMGGLIWIVIKGGGGLGIQGEGINLGKDIVKLHSSREVSFYENFKW